MRIGIDARELCGHSTGVGRYLGGLLNEWSGAGYARRHEFVLYTHEPIALPLDARRFPVHLVKGHGGTRWEQISLPHLASKDHLDVFFSPAYSAPFIPRVPTVVAIHDVSFVAHPEWFSTREGVRRRWLTRRAARLASAVITISEFSRKELIERLNVSDSRIHVIPPGITLPVSRQSPLGAGQPGVASRQSRASGLEPPNVLFVGSIFGRRHVPELIRGFAPIARSSADAMLDIVGDNRTFPLEDVQRAIEIEGLHGRARWHRYVDDDALGALYASARAFAFLSEYEGLGLTPLEALASGVPPVLLDTPVARESCGDAAVYVHTPAPVEITAGLKLALFDEAVRGRILDAAPARLARYDWPAAARETLAVIESV